MKNPHSLPPVRSGGLPRLLTRAILLLFALSVIAIPLFSGYVTDLLSFKEIGFQTVFLQSYFWRAVLFVGGGGFAFVWLYGNAKWARRGAAPSGPVRFQLSPGVIVDLSAVGPRLAVIALVALSFIYAVSLSAEWMTFLTAFKGVTVGTVDPIFGRDLGFYLFRRDLIWTVLVMLRTLTMLAIIIAAVVYGLRGELVLARRHASPQAARHLGGLLSFALVTVAVRLWLLGTSDLLFASTPTLTGASYTDVNVRLPAIYVSIAVALGAAVYIVIGSVRGKLVMSTLIATGTYVVVAFLGREIVPSIYQKLVVAPNELSYERPYLQNHVTATRRAWGLDSVETRVLIGEAQLCMG